MAEDIRHLHGVVESITIRVDSHEARLEDHDARIVVVEDITEKIDAIFHFVQQATKFARWFTGFCKGAGVVIGFLTAIYGVVQGWWF